jgi:hypothetical protein
MGGGTFQRQRQLLPDARSANFVRQRRLDVGVARGFAHVSDDAEAKARGEADGAEDAQGVVKKRLEGGEGCPCDSILKVLKALSRELQCLKN